MRIWTRTKFNQSQMHIRTKLNQIKAYTDKVKSKHIRTMRIRSKLNQMRIRTKLNQKKSNATKLNQIKCVYGQS